MQYGKHMGKQDVELSLRPSGNKIEGCRQGNYCPLLPPHVYMGQLASLYRPPWPTPPYFQKNILIIINILYFFLLKVKKIQELNIFIAFDKLFIGILMERMFSNSLNIPKLF